MVKTVRHESISRNDVMAQHVEDLSMNEELTELLDRHSQALLHGEDPSAELAAAHGDEFPALAGLMTLAHRLRETLVPVRPDEAFTADLRSRLTAMEEKDEKAVTLWTRLRDRLSQRSMVLGTIVSVLAMLAMLVRLVGSVVMLIMLISGNRRRRTAAA